METYGLIFAAGKETRFEGDKPKALSMFGDVCLLDYNINILKRYCDRVFVVCNEQNKKWFATYDTIVIESGKGCGHAVLTALETINPERVVIAWGDCILTEDVIAKTLNVATFDDCLFIPCVYEDKPYVRIERSIGNKRGFVEFGKYNEVTGGGYHDYGCFVCNRMYLLMHLFSFHKKYYKKGIDGYVHKHGNEMQFLDVINETKIRYACVAFDYEAKSFNTINEQKNITL